MTYARMARTNAMNCRAEYLGRIDLVLETNLPMLLALTTTVCRLPRLCIGDLDLNAYG